MEFKNTNMVFIGDNRNGKSLSSMETAFRINNGLLDMQYIHKGFEALIEFYKKIKRQACVLEEIGVVYSRFNWWQPENQEFQKLMESQAFRLNTLCMNVTDMGRIPKWLWGYFTFVCDCVRRRKVTTVTIYEVKKNRLKGTLTFIPRTKWDVELTLPQGLIDEYNEDKEDWNNDNLEQSRLKVLKAHKKFVEVKPELKFNPNSNLGKYDLELETLEKAVRI